MGDALMCRELLNDTFLRERGLATKIDMTME